MLDPEVAVGHDENQELLRIIRKAAGVNKEHIEPSAGDL